jgi:acyl-coenzyme A thioesterase PaaI-like protein
MSQVQALYDRFSSLPAGRKLFSFVFSQKAPYFATIRPTFTELRPNYAALRIHKRRGVQNHIKTVHVIAIANGLEAAMGALAEVTIPADRRWIPKGMELEYTAKADTDIVCIAETDAEAWTSDNPDLPVRVRAERADGTVVVQGTIRLWVTVKPDKV